MLFTRCPHCGTTFRITPEALQKADGQVRCGRCSSIFNARANLREQTEPPSAQAPPAPAAQPPGSAAPDEETADEETVGEPETHPALDAPTPGGGSEVQAEHIVLETPPPGGGVDADADTEALAVLDPTAAWTLEDETDEAAQRGKWGIAAAIATALLAGQLVHHYRAELARQAPIGPLLQTVYSWFGQTLTPRWDLDQYEVVYTGASAEPGTNGQGNLAITARLRNRGPQAQPYPHVRLELLDRWEETVGSRIFRPAEYLPATIPAGTMMTAGDTIDAKLVVVDPGPDAYGFELDVCSQSDSQLRCAGDVVFK